jgi:glutamate-1-semialdehyde 2,1-aminomutase
VDGRVLVDYCMSFGPLILGHAHPEVVEAISRAAMYGTSFAVTTQEEVEFAELIRAAIPSMERLRLVSSGTEACMTAVRLSRGFTGRSKVLKFSGCYHGHADCMLVKAGSGVAGIAAASSAGVPGPCAENTLVARYNSREDVAAVVREHGRDLAAIIVEPVAANAGLMLPAEGFLAFLRAQADGCGALLVFDEVITGFRLTFGGYQQLCGIRPDLTCLGKVIGGGMPIGAVGGRADIMERLAPLGDVYQAGTLSGNPVSVAAGLATLRCLERTRPYETLEHATRRLVHDIALAGRGAGLPLQVPTIGSLFSIFFAPQPVHDFDAVMSTRKELFVTMFRMLLEKGIYLPPSPFEVCFLSVAHDDAVLEATSAAWGSVLAGLAS